MSVDPNSAGSLRATLLTPRGRGAVAVVRVWGPGATPTVDRMFASAAGRSLATFPLERIVFGRWHGCSTEASNAGEELVVCRRAADDIEIHCHGGVASSTAIFAALEAAGAVIVPWTEWSAERTGDRIKCEAETALAEAKTSRTAGILLDQLAGGLSRAVDEILAALDRNDVAEARRLLEVLSSRVSLGRHLTTPFQVVLAGRPNVGKSSLINALVGYERSIVFDKPGTTRDVVTASAVFDGWPIELSDTAGLRDSTDLLERAGMNAARRRLLAADLVVLVFDASEAWTEEDEALCGENPTAAVVHNKIDRTSGPISARPKGLEISAVTNRGIEELIRAIASRLIPNPPQRGDAVPFTERQIELLDRAGNSLAARNVVEARRLLTLLPRGEGGGVLADG
jgi:tRNA modification GTPase